MAFVVVDKVAQWMILSGIGVAPPRNLPVSGGAAVDGGQRRSTVKLCLFGLSASCMSFDSKSRPDRSGEVRFSI